MSLQTRLKGGGQGKISGGGKKGVLSSTSKKTRQGREQHFRDDVEEVDPLHTGKVRKGQDQTPDRRKKEEGKGFTRAPRRKGGKEKVGHDNQSITRDAFTKPNGRKRFRAKRNQEGGRKMPRELVARGKGAERERKPLGSAGIARAKQGLLARPWGAKSGRYLGKKDIIRKREERTGALVGLTNHKRDRPKASSSICSWERR